MKITVDAEEVSNRDILNLIREVAEARAIIYSLDDDIPDHTGEEATEILDYLEGEL